MSSPRSAQIKHINKLTKIGGNGDFEKNIPATRASDRSAEMLHNEPNVLLQIFRILPPPPEKWRLFEFYVGIRASKRFSRIVWATRFQDCPNSLKSPAWRYIGSSSVIGDSQFSYGVRLASRSFFFIFLGLAYRPTPANAMWRLMAHSARNGVRMWVLWVSSKLFTHSFRISSKFRNFTFQSRFSLKASINLSVGATKMRSIIGNVRIKV